MDIKQLKARGGIVTSPPVPVEVTWTHKDPETGELVTDTFTVHVLRKSVGWMDRAIRMSSRDVPNSSRTAAIIAEGIRFGVDGTERLSYEDAVLLDYDLASALIDAFTQVNKADADPKNLQQKMNFGASSSSAESVVAQ